MTGWMAKSQAEWNLCDPSTGTSSADRIRLSVENMKTAFALLPDGMKIVP
jgi:hypothetical protein